MQERAFRFGRAQHMIGIAGVPEQPAETPGVIVLNAGLVHRIGPFRLHVELARRLNACGYPTLRFDLSTVGDSAASEESQTREQQVCADVDDAMTLLGEQAGCTRFVVIGLCSGAQNAHTVACVDPKIAGAVFLDGYAYRTFGYKLRRYLPKLLDPASWRRALTHRQRSVEVAAGEAVFSVAPLPIAVVRQDLTGMLARGLKLCLIYSGGISNYSIMRVSSASVSVAWSATPTSARIFSPRPITPISSPATVVGLSRRSNAGSLSSFQASTPGHRHEQGSCHRRRRLYRQPYRLCVAGAR